MAIGTLQVNFCEVGVRFNLWYSFFYCYIRKVLRCGIGVYIGKLRSAAIVYEPDFISVWFWDSPKGTNNGRLHVCYCLIAFANFLTDLVFYFVAYIACGRWFVVGSFRLFQNAMLGIISKPFVIPLIIKSLSRSVSRFCIQACGLSANVIMACGSIRSHTVGAVGCSCCGWPWLQFGTKQTCWNRQFGQRHPVNELNWRQIGFGLKVIFTFLWVKICSLGTNFWARNDSTFFFKAYPYLWIE